MGKLIEGKDPFEGAFSSLEDLADRISELLGCPVTIEDSSHHILAYSTHDENVDPARIATIMRRKVPENVISSLWKNGVIPKLFESEDPVVIPPIEQVGLGKRVAISVRKNKELLGFIWAQVNWDLTEEEQMILKQASKVVKNQMLKLQIKKRKAEQNYEEFFWKLLTGHLTEEEAIHIQAAKFNLQLTGHLGVIIFEFEEDIHQSLERHANYYIGASQKVKLICSVIDENQLILLVAPLNSNKPSQDVNEFVQQFVETIGDRLGLEHIRGGSGTIYRNPADIAESYQEALQVLTLKGRFPKETATIYNYQELGIFQFLDVIYEKRVRDNYKNYYIERLKQYDQEHRANLLETIDVYLQCDSNINVAAKELHVHANTLNYRLKRISEITEINLKDPNQKITLYIDLKIENIKAYDL